MCETLDKLGFTISIHALREEGDVVFRPEIAVLIISIHALREEGDILHLMRKGAA